MHHKNFLISLERDVQDPVLRAQIIGLIQQLSDLHSKEVIHQLSDEIFRLSGEAFQYMDPTIVFNWLLPLVGTGELYEEFYKFMYQQMQRYKTLDKYVEKHISQYLSQLGDDFDSHALYSEFLLDQEDVSHFINTLSSTIKYYLETDLFSYAGDLFIKLLENAHRIRNVVVVHEKLDAIATAIANRYQEQLQSLSDVSEEYDNNKKIIKNIYEFLLSVLHNKNQLVEIMRSRLQDVWNGLEEEHYGGITANIARITRVNHESSAFITLLKALLPEARNVMQEILENMANELGCRYEELLGSLTNEEIESEKKLVVDICEYLFSILNNEEESARIMRSRVQVIWHQLKSGSYRDVAVGAVESIEADNESDDLGSETSCSEQQDDDVGAGRKHGYEEDSEEANQSWRNCDDSVSNNSLQYKTCSVYDAVKIVDLGASNDPEELTDYEYVQKKVQEALASIDGMLELNFENAEDVIFALKDYSSSVLNLMDDEYDIFYVPNNITFIGDSFDLVENDNFILGSGSNLSHWSWPQMISV